MSGLSKNCWNCGAEFSCGANATGCWCEGHAALRPAEGKDCLCPDCLVSAAASQQRANAPPALVEGEDYYMEGPSVVFTAAYHLRRGYCCGNGCRHCPY